MSETLSSHALCWIPLITPDRRCWAALTVFQPLENTGYGVHVSTLLFTVTCILSPCRLGKYWGPRRLKMRTSRLRLSPSRGKEKQLHQFPNLKSEITLRLGRAVSCYCSGTPYVCTRGKCHVKRWSLAYEICLRGFNELFRGSSLFSKTKLKISVFYFPKQWLGRNVLRLLFLK